MRHFSGVIAIELNVTRPLCFQILPVHHRLVFMPGQDEAYVMEHKVDHKLYGPPGIPQSPIGTS